MPDPSRHSTRLSLRDGFAESVSIVQRARRHSFRDLVDMGTAAVWLRVFESLVQRAGFRRSLRIAELGRLRHSYLPGRGSADPVSAAQRIGALVNVMAYRRTPPYKCLPRALATVTLTSWRGIPSKVVFGVGEGPDAALFDLEAHAWVEVDSNPVNDSADVRTRFRPFEPVAQLRTANDPQRNGQR